MTASEIRQRFLDYFERHGHTVRPSSSLVPADDPTLLFTNAGMVQFKRAFLGEEKPGFPRAATSQKCLRVSGKHNDLEEVGVTARHHTFFEMLGNFSFGDYFKRDAIAFAWELLTKEYGLPGERLFATVHYSDDAAAALWREIAGLPDSRIFRLGDKDNFWQMGDTGPCGPCSELHFDLRPKRRRGKELTLEAFVAAGERGEFLELWNLVFMQFDRKANGELEPLPAPSIDTGAGLERLASVLQGVDSNYQSDLFVPLIECAVSVVGVPFDDAAPTGVSYRVLADHARAVAFLLADGVFPTNEGRGYVLRRILRRAVRHAWLLGRRAPTLVEVVGAVVERMGDVYPELRERREHLLRATRMEEERFLETIDTGMARFEEVAPEISPEQRAAIETGRRKPRLLSGEDAFRLYDTFGFPLDLTELIARERGYKVDTAAFEAALEQQRERSRADRRAAGVEVAADELSTGWEELAPAAEQQFVGYRLTSLETEVIAFRREDGRLALQLRENPFYVEAGGQVSDHGVVEGDDWSVLVDDVRRVAGRVAVLGRVEGEFPGGRAPFRVRARVEQPTRHETEKNHTATHLLHAALRKVLGPHVLQRGSLVAPDRLRFDFSHPRPMTAEELRAVEEEANRAILADLDVCIDFLGYREAVGRGAMALFGEKYGEVVRMISVPGVSMELCGGTHVRHTGEIGMLRIVSETGIAAGIRRIEAVTGEMAYRRALEQEETLRRAAALLKTAPDNLLRRLEQLVEENRELVRRLERARAPAELVAVLNAEERNGVHILKGRVPGAHSSEDLRPVADFLRQSRRNTIGLLSTEDGRSLLTVVTRDVEQRVSAGELARLIGGSTGGGGGGRSHMAQAGIGDPERFEEAVEKTLDFLLPRSA